MFTNVLVMLYSTMHFSNMCIYIFFGIAGIITLITFEVSFGLVNMKVFLVLGKITHFLWIREKKIVNGVWMHNVAKKFTVCLWRTKKYFQQPLILFFHVYLRRGLQKHARNSNPMMVFKLPAIFEGICVCNQLSKSNWWN